MLKRWAGRACWAVVFVALVLVPTRLAQGPAVAVAADDGGAKAPFQHFSPVAWVTVGGLVGGFTLLALLRRGRMRHL